MARFEVYISDEGLAEIDGEPLVPPPGQSVHEVVLDHLHRYAVERGGPVEATVAERPGQGHFVLQVAPDGSSRLLEPSLVAGSEHVPDPTPEPEHVPGPGPTPEPEPVPEFDLGPESVPGPGHASEPGHESAPDSGTGPEPGTAPEPPPGPGPVGATAIAAAVARAAAAARAATSAPARAAVHAPVPAVAVPAELAERIGHVSALASAGRLDEAYDLASELRRRLTEEAGADAPHAVEARALEAYIAHLRGDHREAVVLALAVARIRCGAGDRRAPEDVARAAAAWQWLDDERAIVVHGQELLHMWEQLSLRGPLSTSHAALAGRIRRRVEALEVLVRAFR
ncbi:hypothetical protein [Streptomyces mexicanus]|uniref:hypothetical protein n=1 Tax=Streptomyces mexicanus TaxID=178566 RepID=UPI00366425DA